jgi:hypothetical protein
VCSTGRVSDRLVDRWLATLNKEFTKHTAHVRRAVEEKGEETWEQWCASADRTMHSMYDIRFEHVDVMALRGLDFPATQRRLAEQLGSETDVIVLIDGTELRQTAFDPWRAVRPGGLDG